MRNRVWMSCVAMVLAALLLVGCSSDSEEASASPSAQRINATVSVDCKLATDAGHEAALVVAQDGVVYAEQEMIFDPGATAYDALKATGLVVGAQSSAMGIYVQSIDGLNEGACGEQSGWLFTINGEVPDYSSDACILNDGDSVQWRYSLSYGEDL